MYLAPALHSFIEDYLREECAQGRIIRMGIPEAVEGLHFSPFGVMGTRPENGG